MTPLGTCLRFFAAASLMTLLTACGGGGDDTAAPPAIDPPPVVTPADTAPSISTAPQSQSVLTPGKATFTVAATGTAPFTHQWRRNGVDIAGATAASYTTPATAVGDHGASYTVVVSNAKGSVTSSAATLSVAPGRVRLFASSWFEPAVRITDDVLSSPSPASPASLSGAATGLNTATTTRDIAVDSTRELLYKVDGKLGRILVWANAAALAGNLAPSRIITIDGATKGRTICLDAAADRLYLIVETAAGRRLARINQASTRSGSVTPDALVDLGVAIDWLTLDPSANRLYGTTSGDTVFVFDNASSLRSGSVAATRTFTLPGLYLADLAVDGVRNRLYLSSRDDNTVYVFANASSLSGTIANPAATAAARWTEYQAMGVTVDSQDRVWWWGDSATKVSMYANASTLSGLVSKPADKVIEGVIKYGYGVQLWLY